MDGGGPIRVISLQPHEMVGNDQRPLLGMKMSDLCNRIYVQSFEMDEVGLICVCSHRSVCRPMRWMEMIRGLQMDGDSLISVMRTIMCTCNHNRVFIFGNAEVL